MTEKRDQDFEDLERAFAARFEAFVDYLDEGGGDAAYHEERKKPGRGPRTVKARNQRKRQRERISPGAGWRPMRRRSS